MENILLVLKEFQDNYPESHVGGSVALHILGFDLERDLSKSDLDIILHHKDIDNESIRNNGYDFIMMSSRNEEYDFSLLKNDVKIDIVDCDIFEFKIIEFNGVKYRVALLESIVGAKISYLNQGSNIEKHTKDLKIIETSEIKD